MPRCWIGLVLVPLAAAMLTAGCSRRKSQADEPPRANEAAESAGDTADPAPWPVRHPAPRKPDGRTSKLLKRLEGRRPALPKRSVKGPWADAKAGSFATYRGAGGLTVTKTVVQVTPKAVTLDVSTTLSGRRASRRLSLPRMVPDGQRAHSIPPDAHWSRQEVLVGSRQVACRVATWPKTAGTKTRQIRIHLSDEVPGQVVRSARVDAEGNAKVSWELIDFGR